MHGPLLLGKSVFRRLRCQWQTATCLQVLQVGPESPTVFRIDVAQAGEH
jgi:hypothetical protein